MPGIPYPIKHSTVLLIRLSLNAATRRLKTCLISADVGIDDRALAVFTLDTATAQSVISLTGRDTIGARAGGGGWRECGLESCGRPHALAVFAINDSLLSRA